MDISLDLYRIFAAVARSGSFSGASREMYISQPAVSQAMQRLEDACGAQLFDRGARGVTLTSQGEVLRGYVSSALGLISAGEEKLRELGELQGGELRIGAGDTVSQWYLMPAIERFHRLYPEVALSITNRTSRETAQLLQEGKIDIGFVNMPLPSEGLLFEECLSVHDVFVAGEDFRERLEGRALSPAELAALPLIMLERTSNTRRRVDSFFMQRGIPLSPQIELGSHDLLSGCARAGLGVACAVREFTDMSGLFELLLAEPLPSRSIGVCSLDGIAISAAARRFIDLAAHAPGTAPPRRG